MRPDPVNAFDVISIEATPPPPPGLCRKIIGTRRPFGGPPAAVHCWRDAEPGSEFCDRHTPDLPSNEGGDHARGDSR